MPHKIVSKAQGRWAFANLGQEKTLEMLGGDKMSPLSETVKEGGKSKSGQHERLRAAATAALRESRKKGKKKGKGK